MAVRGKDSGAPAVRAGPEARLQQMPGLAICGRRGSEILAHRSDLHRRRGAERQDRQHQFQPPQPAPDGARPARGTRNHGGRRPGGVARRLRRCGRAGRRRDRERGARADGGRSQPGGGGGGGRRGARPPARMAGDHPRLLPPARARNAAQQPQAGHAAGRRGIDRQPRRHRLRLRDRHWRGAVFLHPGGAVGTRCDDRAGAGPAPCAQ